MSFRTNIAIVLVVIGLFLLSSCSESGSEIDETSVPEDIEESDTRTTPPTDDAEVEGRNPEEGDEEWGRCGDNVVQRDFSEECDESSSRCTACLFNTIPTKTTVNSKKEGDQSSVDVAMTEDGHLALLWVDSDLREDTDTLFLQEFKGTSPLKLRQLIGSDSRSSPKVALSNINSGADDADILVHVAWEGVVPDQQFTIPIYSQSFSSVSYTSKRERAVVYPNCWTAGNYDFTTEPATTSPGSYTYLAWSNLDNCELEGDIFDKNDIFFQQDSLVGTRQLEYPGEQTYPKIFVAENGDVSLFFTSNKDIEGEDPLLGYRAYYEHLNRTSSTRSTTQVKAGYQLIDYDFSVSMDGYGGFVIVDDGYDSKSLFAYQFDNEGKLGSNSTVVNYGRDNRYSSLHRLAVNNAGSFVVIWSPYPLKVNPPENEDIAKSYQLFMRRYDTIGNSLDPEGGILVDSAKYSRYNNIYSNPPSVAIDGSGNVVVAYADVGADGNGAGIVAKYYPAGSSEATDLVGSPLEEVEIINK